MEIHELDKLREIVNELERFVPENDHTQTVEVEPGVWMTVSSDENPDKIINNHLNNRIERQKQAFDQYKRRMRFAFAIMIVVFIVSIVMARMI